MENLAGFAIAIAQQLLRNDHRVRGHRRTAPHLGRDDQDARRLRVHPLPFTARLQAAAHPVGHTAVHLVGPHRQGQVEYQPASLVIQAAGGIILPTARAQWHLFPITFARRTLPHQGRVFAPDSDGFGSPHVKGQL